MSPVYTGPKGEGDQGGEGSPEGLGGYPLNSRTFALDTPVRPYYHILRPIEHWLTSSKEEPKTQGSPETHRVPYPFPAHPGDGRSIHSLRRTLSEGHTVYADTARTASMPPALTLPVHLKAPFSLVGIPSVNRIPLASTTTTLAGFCPLFRWFNLYGGPPGPFTYP